MLNFVEYQKLYESEKWSNAALEEGHWSPPKGTFRDKSPEEIADIFLKASKTKALKRITFARNRAEQGSKIWKKLGIVISIIKKELKEESE